MAGSASEAVPAAAKNFYDTWGLQKFFGTICRAPRYAHQPGASLVQGGLRVSSPDELRSYAVDCARLARTATDPLDKARLLNMARAWSDLADRIEKIRDVGDRVAAGDTTEAASSGLPHVPPPETAAPDQQ